MTKLSLENVKGCEVIQHEEEYTQKARWFCAPCILIGLGLFILAFSHIRLPFPPSGTQLTLLMLIPVFSLLGVRLIFCAIKGNKKRQCEDCAQKARRNHALYSLSGCGSFLVAMILSMAAREMLLILLIPAFALFEFASIFADSYRPERYTLRLTEELPASVLLEIQQQFDFKEGKDPGTWIATSKKRQS